MMKGQRREAGGERERERVEGTSLGSNESAVDTSESWVGPGGWGGRKPAHMRRKIATIREG